MIEIKSFISAKFSNQTSMAGFNISKGKLWVGLGCAAIFYCAARYFFTSGQSAVVNIFNSKLLKTRGHFTAATYPQYQAQAIKVVQKIFDRIVDHEANNGWDWIYISQKAAIFEKNLFQEVDASCSGNCLALGKAIIRRGKILTAAELQAIEQEEKFPQRAMGFQLFQLASREIIKREGNSYQNPNTRERPYHLTEEEKQILGARAHYFDCNRYVQNLKSYGLSFAEVAKLSPPEFSALWTLIQTNVPIEWARKVFKMPDATTEQLLERGSTNFPNPMPLHIPQRKVKPAYHNYPQLIYPKPSTMAQRNLQNEEPFYFYDGRVKKSELVKEYPNVETPSFSGFFTIHGKDNPDKEAGHVLLLAIDHCKEIYVLYDNNEGFYTGKNLEECLEQLNTYLKSYKYPVIYFYPFVFGSSEVKA